MSKSTGVVTRASGHSFDETVDRLRGAISERGLILFLALDQQAAARKEGLTMPRSQLLVFGSPKAGTQILIDFPEAGLDLPLKAYVWESSNGAVFVSYSEPAYIAERHGLSIATAAPLYGIVPLIEGALDT